MKPYASLSLDLDNQWSYLKTHGSPEWKEFPSYLDVAVPRILDFLRARNLAITFFIVGQDAALEKNRDALRSLATAGHEIGNHSFNHEPWLHLYSEADLDAELARAEEHIEKATGVRPIGFRGPGFSLSGATLRVLAKRGYQYDCTVFPNVLNPLARAYFFATSNLSKEEREQRKALFGTLADALRPVKPFRWELGAGELLEIPVTTMPLVKVPIHLSYVLYLSKFSRPLARLYFRIALRMCQMTGTAPSILLHPLDFMGAEDAPALRFFPGMDIPRERKLELVAETLDLMGARYELVTMREHASRLRNDRLRKMAPDFPPAPTREAVSG
jgi:peptidoglycan/xylan/chitin deacetylase (PgdA/CDA1 family)